MDELVDELLEYFDMESGEWPWIRVYANGEPGRGGVIDEQLYQLLIRLREARSEST